MHRQRLSKRFLEISFILTRKQSALYLPFLALYTAMNILALVEFVLQQISEYLREYIFRKWTAELSLKQIYDAMLANDSIRNATRQALVDQASNSQVAAAMKCKLNSLILLSRAHCLLQMCRDISTHDALVVSRNLAS